MPRSPASALSVRHPCRPRPVLWARLPCAADSAAPTIDAGIEVTIDTISHEGILKDEGNPLVARAPTFRSVGRITRDAAISRVGAQSILDADMRRASGHVCDLGPIGLAENHTTAR